MQPRTGAESASCAFRTSWLYHSEKSCARVGSFSSAMRKFIRSSQLQQLGLSKFISVSDAHRSVNETGNLGSDAVWHLKSHPKLRHYRNPEGPGRLVSS